MGFFGKKTNGKKNIESEQARGALTSAPTAAPSGADSSMGSYAHPPRLSRPNQPAPPMPPPASPAPTTHSANALPPEELKKRAAQAKLKAAAFGEVVAVLMRSAPYRATTLAELEGLVVPAVLTGQFSLAEVQSKQNGLMAPVGVVFWALVSADVDQRLSAELNTPIKLAPQEWKSGEIVWVVDAVGDQRVITPMLQGLAKGTWYGKPVKMRVRDKDGRVRVGTITFKPNAP
jgi:hemolysin-activating ACP:hemolysin acyltransferase